MEFEIRKRYDVVAVLFSLEELKAYLCKKRAQFAMFDDIKVQGELTYVGDIHCKGSCSEGHALYARHPIRSSLEEVKKNLRTLEGQRKTGLVSA